ncbi:hypothetical protein EYW49_03065 [Siculibacillus lacustris]|uniref:Hydantoin racemase n=1 Tax=Siculibacillus lacustris TaxID=1549641 RepID=A0A4Q9VXR8_9HYPH|nr:aspartate/glutamate racemase family protein [Siculibacillus lacustris]TBW40724.1 hypothetical protein EYW49_03065 [Siculibacillus lacustris]
MVADMNILVINPNTTTAVTDRFVAEARAVAPCGVTIDGVTGRFGAAVVTTRAENVLAAHAALELAARHHATYDAVILAISFDSGWAAADEIVPIPVVAITRAALESAFAAAGDQPVGLVLFGAASRPLYEDLVASYGWGSRICGLEVVEIDGVAGYLAPDAHDDAVLAAVTRLAAQRAGAVVVCGAAIVGIARRIAPRAAVPVFDGAAPAVAAALRRAAAPRDPHVPPPVLAAMTGVDPALAALIARGRPDPTRNPPPSPPEGKVQP